MTPAQRQLAQLRNAGVANLEVDWEQLLRLNYCVLLHRSANIIDVGGNYGSHTQCFAEDLQARRVAVFEPIPDLFQRLRYRFQAYSSIVIYPYALSDKNGPATFYWKKTSDAESGLAAKNVYADGSRDNLTEISVDVRTLDALDIGFSPDFIKIDIEGAEIDMLKGSATILKYARPIISVEYGSIGYEAFGHKQTSLMDLANFYEYSVFDLFGNKFENTEDFVACVNAYYWDYIMIPNEKIGFVDDRIEIIGRLTASIPMSKWRTTNLDIVNRILGEA